MLIHFVKIKYFRHKCNSNLHFSFENFTLSFGTLSSDRLEPIGTIMKDCEKYLIGQNHLRMMTSLSHVTDHGRLVLRCNYKILFRALFLPI